MMLWHDTAEYFFIVFTLLLTRIIYRTVAIDQIRKYVMSKVTFITQLKLKASTISVTETT